MNKAQLVRELAILVLGALMGASFAIQASNGWQSPLGTALSLCVAAVAVTYAVFAATRRRRGSRGL